MTKSFRTETIEDVLIIFGEYERQVICMRFGIGMDRHSIQDIAKVLSSKKHPNNPISFYEVYRKMSRGLYKIKGGALDIFVSHIENTLTGHSADYVREKWCLARCGVSLSKLKLFDVEDNIDGILQSLPPIEERILRARFGIGIKRCLPGSGREGNHYISGNLGKNRHTLEEISIMLGVIGERVRQIECRAFRMMRHPARLSALVSLFENGLYSNEILNLARAVMESGEFTKLKIWDPMSAPVEGPLQPGPKPEIIFHPVMKS